MQRDRASVPPWGLLLGASCSDQLEVKIKFSAVGFLGTKNCDFWIWGGFFVMGRGHGLMLNNF